MAVARVHERLLGHAALLLASAIAIFPFAWAILLSVDVVDVERATGRFSVHPSGFTLADYVWIWTNQPLDRWIFNSLIVTVAVVIVIVHIDALVGYALAKGSFPGKRHLYLVVIGLLVIPPRVVLVPVYIEIVALDLDNTYWGILLPFLANPLGAFLMRQYFLSIPDSLLEAARLDGCSTFQLYTRVLLPMAKPALALLAVFTFTFTWNALLWPMVIVTDESMYTLQVGLAFGTNLAGVVIATLPVVVFYLLAHRTFKRGLTLPARLN